MNDIQLWIKETITQNFIVLFMKGTPKFPQCGFSSKAMQLLQASCTNSIFTVNVLENQAIRQGIKTYSNWPTIPQLYVNSKFIGGSDIMNEMFQSGELKTLFQN